MAPAAPTKVDLDSLVKSLLVAKGLTGSIPMPSVSEVFWKLLLLHGLTETMRACSVVALVSPVGPRRHGFAALVSLTPSKHGEAVLRLATSDSSELFSLS